MSYSNLQAHFTRISHLRHIESFVRWDETVMMPPAAAAARARAEATSTLCSVIHAMLTEPKLEKWLLASERRLAALNPWERANLRRMQRAWLKASSLPATLVEQASSAEMKCTHLWREARSNNDWNSFHPALESVIAIKRKIADTLAKTLNCDPYDALLDAYEPGMRSQQLDTLFAPLRPLLPDLIRQAHNRRPSPWAPIGPFTEKAQQKLIERLLRTVGFDIQRGRLDVSHHPSCGGVPDDVRITTRYNRADFTRALMGALHEAGHAKYEQHLPAGWRNQPVGLACSLGIHESQSLLQEMHICRSKPFLRFIAPMIRKAFPGHASRQPDAFNDKNICNLYRQVEPGPIRIYADEMTYPCHILLRYDMEKALITGHLKVSEIPERWEADTQRLLGLSNKGDFRNGCMQDPHWAGGAFGYFPVYLLGAIYAAQFFASASRENPHILEQIGNGQFAPLDAWLEERIWSKGSLYDSESLLRHATGRKPSIEDYVTHLHSRYLS
ncbi:MAG: carboxypeptidase M32 [Candidatus Thiodiazotropha sp. (ex Epidulcina cf. delphinae)]|nr:carboxypeptidase M32 [Candidatus Thiodiazotropha sp. (ex Epidulcina cf. delphinae)]